MFLIIFILIIIPLNLNASRIFLYLNIEHKINIEKELFIKQIIIIDSNSIKKTIKINKNINPSIFKFNQTFLKKIELKHGIYNSFEIVTAKNRIKIPFKLKLNKDEIKCVFLMWNVRGSFKNNKFKPLLYLKNQEIPLRGEMLFVSSQYENALFFVRVDKNQVCAAMSIKGEPSELILFCSNDKVYILCKKSRDIKVVEVTAFKISDVYVLPFVSNPDLITKSNDSLIIGDSKNNKILIIDFFSGNIKNSFEIGECISDIEYSQIADKIVVLSKYEQIAYLIDKSFQRKSILKLSCQPDYIYKNNEFLYITESNCNVIERYNLNKNLFDKKYRIFQPGRIELYNTTFFITSMVDKALYVLYKGQTSYSKKIILSLIPDRMAICVRRGWLYVSGKDTRKIEVIDINYETSHGVIDLGVKPYDIKIGRTNNSCK